MACEAIPHPMAGRKDGHFLDKPPTEAASSFLGLPMPKFCLEINASDRKLKARLDALAAHLVNLERIIMDSQDQTADRLDALTAQGEKARAEIRADLQRVLDELANAPVNPKLKAAVDRLAASIQKQDDEYADPPPPPPADPIP